MNIVTLFKLVPDLVEELDIDQSGTALNMDYLRLIINEFDDHAIEQAILLKERSGAQVSVVGPNMDEAEDVLYTAAAKGADQMIKLAVDFQGMMNNHVAAGAVASTLKELQPDLILTGVQANTDLDGSIGPLLAEYLDMPYVGYVSGVNVVDGKVVARKEYPGGLIAEMEIKLPAVLGIQAAEQPPRYVAVTKVRQAMKTATIEERPLAELDLSGGLTIHRMFKPEVSARAEMIEGDADEVAARLIGIFKEIGVL
ncbi:MAG: electron transfer flavoprotein subunit beta/FixA family protein [Anaerolineaceae bacterium]|nr:MAG: electron transfer flavoprotein subunit beta/FixA family protein [Anaerolineaceae bacterium]